MTAENAENAGAAAKYSKKSEAIFSQEALDKMRSPEKLDTVLPITSPISWMGLIAVAVMMLAVVLWSIFGSFTVKANGMGMIMDPKGVVNGAVRAGTGYQRTGRDEPRAGIRYAPQPKERFGIHLQQP